MFECQNGVSTPILEKKELTKLSQCTTKFEPWGFFISLNIIEPFSEGQNIPYREVQQLASAIVHPFTTRI